MEEATIISDLRAIGMDVRTPAKGQDRVDFGSHVSGSVDGIIESGVPEAPKARHVAEFKTHSKKSFDDLSAKGVEKSKPLHYIQMQAYMAGMKIDRALYVAVGKDDDSIYTERVRYDAEIATKYIERAKRIALSDRMPPPLSTDPSWYECKYCPAYKFCFQTQTTEHVNCRTCAHSTAKADSTWRCERHDADGIPVEFQREGCESHVLHPDLVPWPRKDGLDDWTAVYVIEGRDVANGDGDAHVYTSREILANPKACSLGDELIETLRGELGARVVPWD
jgi:CRISPR/Cas system-associated exonuclease Cas4 (RecB family)